MRQVYGLNIVQVNQTSKEQNLCLYYPQPLGLSRFEWRRVSRKVHRASEECPRPAAKNERKVVYYEPFISVQCTVLEVRVKRRQRRTVYAGEERLYMYEWNVSAECKGSGSGQGRRDARGRGRRARSRLR